MVAVRFLPALVAIWLVLLRLAPAAPVSAHADLIRAEPAAGSNLQQAPAQLTLFFTQRLKPEGSWVRLDDSRGQDVPVTYAIDSADAKVMRVTLPALKPDTYKVRWQTLSADDDDYAGGSYGLTVLEAGASGGSPEESSGDAGAGGGGVALYAGIAVAVVALIGGFVWRRTRRT
jgi:methionine-rich copper-binding protein CopC